MATLALDTRDVALDLYALLREIDPARWRDTVASSARERLHAIEQRVARLVEVARPHEAALRARLEEILRVVRAYARNAFHVASATLVVALLELFFDTSGRMLAVGFACAALGWTLEATRRLSGPWNTVLMVLFGPVAHPHEAHRVNSATWYV